MKATVTLLVQYSIVELIELATSIPKTNIYDGGIFHAFATASEYAILPDNLRKIGRPGSSGEGLSERAHRHIC